MKHHKYGAIVLAGIILPALLSVDGCATSSDKSPSSQTTNVVTKTNTARTMRNDASASGMTNSLGVNPAGKSTKPTIPSPVTVKLPNTIHKFDLSIQYRDGTSSSEVLFPEKTSASVQQWNFPKPQHSISDVPKQGNHIPQYVTKNEVDFVGLSSPSAENTHVAWHTPIGHIMVIPLPNNTFEVVFAGLTNVENMRIEELTTHKPAKFVPYKPGENPAFATYIVHSSTWYSLTERGIGSTKTIVFPNFKITSD